MATDYNWDYCSKWPAHKDKKERMEKAQKSRKETKTLKKLLEKKQRLTEKLTELKTALDSVDTEVKESCPHKVEWQLIQSFYYYDDWDRSGETSNRLDCLNCGQKLDEWKEFHSY